MVWSLLFVLAALDDMDLTLVVQTLIHKCMENEHLCNECFLQLIKQTTDTKSGMKYSTVFILYALTFFESSIKRQ